jgi:multiple sugar transport system substrate-binding protein
MVGMKPLISSRRLFDTFTTAILSFLLALIISGCSDGKVRTTLRFWTMGREGEIVQELTREFEKQNPAIRVDVQQIPWSAAHEKLLTAYVGRSTPDLAQLGNTWMAEFAALKALEPLGAWLASSAVVESSGYFPGIWETNVIDGEPFGIPWYVDTRVLFYRRDILARAGYSSMPRTWDQWHEAMESTKEVVGPEKFAIFLPANEWTQPVILGLSAGSTLLMENDTRGAFAEPAFSRAFDFYLDLFRNDLAPSVGNNEVANLYQEFARGYFAMYITGPWNLGEFRRRLPEELQDDWATAPLPGPDASTPGVSLAGGASLVMFRGSRHKEAAWKLMEFLSLPKQQLRFYRLSGDLPARREAWTDAELKADDKIQAFWEQLQRVAPTPKIPEWEQIAARVQERAELAVRGGASADEALALMDRDVERILEKRRWLLKHDRLPATARGASKP